MKITVSMEDVRQSASYLKQKANEYDAVVQKIYTTMHQLEAIWKGKDVSHKSFQRLPYRTLSDKDNLPEIR